MLKNLSINRISAIKNFIPLIFLWMMSGFFTGCESITPETSVLYITIEMTASEMVNMDGEEIPVDDLDDRLEELSENHDLHFIIKTHPEMRMGTSFRVNELVMKHGVPWIEARQTVVQIGISQTGEIRIDENKVSLEELDNSILEHTSVEDIMIRLRVEQHTDEQTIRNVLELIKHHEIPRTHIVTVEDLR
jgi:biopolymer transport protein ExbD